MASSSSPPSWDTLRRQARTLEASLDSKLTTYAKLASNLSSPGPSSSSGSGPGEPDLDELESGGVKVAEEEVEELLGKLTATVDQLTEVINNPDRPAPSTSTLNASQRHREVLADYRRDFLQTKRNVEHARNSRNLLGSVRRDISAYKTARSSAADALLNERSTIDSSHRMTDDILEQAYATRSDFASQRATITGVQSRLGQTLTQLPGINSLLGLIQSKRRRDNIILGVIIGLCIIGLLSYIT